MAPRHLPARPPLFILSSERAGSTLLRLLLDTHPAICCPGEILLGQLCHQLTLALRWTIGQSPGLTEQELGSEVRTIVDSIMDRYAEAKGKRIWCEKSPYNLSYIDDLWRVFPDARFICLHRHALDVAQSCLRTYGDHPNSGLQAYQTRFPGRPVEAALHCWIDQTRRLLDLERRAPAACHRITYEALVQSPEGSLASLFTFLDLEPAPSLVDEVFCTEHDDGYGDDTARHATAIDPSRIGRGGDLELGGLPSAVRREVDLLLDVLGYSGAGAAQSHRAVDSRLAPQRRGDKPARTPSRFTASAYGDRERLEALRRHHLAGRRSPKLRQLVWQATLNCNLRCGHCFVTKQTGGSLDTTQARAIFDDIASHVDAATVQVGITGGEPLVRKDLIELVGHIRSIGFGGVGISSNGFALGQRPERLDRLVAHGLGALNVSLDGPEPHHNQLRRNPKAYRYALASLQHARRAHPSLRTAITVAISPTNLPHLTEMIDLAITLGVQTVKVVGVMPYGEGRDGVLTLSDTQLVWLLHEISRQRQRHARGEIPVEVTFTDDGFLACYEGVARGGLFNCPAGVSVATIWHDGRLAACPQLEQPFNFQGSLLEHRFGELWSAGFRPFRNRAWLRRGPCRRCDDWRYCMGGSLHDRDAEGNLLRCNARLIRAVHGRGTADEDR